MNEFDGLTKGGIFAAMKGDPLSFAEWLGTPEAQKIAADAFYDAQENVRASLRVISVDDKVGRAFAQADAYIAIDIALDDGYNEYLDGR